MGKWRVGGWGGSREVRRWGSGESEEVGVGRVGGEDLWQRNVETVGWSSFTLLGSRRSNEEWALRLLEQH